MRCFWLFLALALAAGSPVPAPAAEPPSKEPDQPMAEPALEEMPGKLLGTVDTGGHTSPLTQLLFSADSKEVITASSDKTLRIWDLATGQTSRVLRPPSTA